MSKSAGPSASLVTAMPWISRLVCLPGTTHVLLPSHSRSRLRPASVESQRPSSRQCRCSPSMSIAPENNSPRSSVPASKLQRKNFGRSLIAPATAPRVQPSHASSTHDAKRHQRALPQNAASRACRERRLSLPSSADRLRRPPTFKVDAASLVSGLRSGHVEAQ